MQKKWSKPLIIFTIFIVQIILYSLLFSSEIIVDFIVNRITFPVSSFISKITNSVTFPVGELFYLVFGIIVLIVVLRIIKSFISNRNFLPNRLVELLILMNVTYFVYTFAWGIMYKKETLTFEKDSVNIDPKLLKEIYCSELEKAIYYRSLLNKSDTEPIKYNSDLEVYNKDFHQLQYKLKDLNWIKNYHFLEHNHFKLSNISMLQNYLGILGYYNPFTVEANLNSYNTYLKQPSTMFHEYGHKMGFASENEANFLAYYLGTLSNNPEVNYSVYYKSIYSLLGAIYKTDPYFVKMEMDNMHPKIKIDRKAEIDYYAKYEGKTSDTFSELNNQFLKANNQEGTISYSKYVEFIYYLYLQKNGTKF